MPDFTAFIDIFVPADRVFEYIRDVTHLPEYTPMISSAESQHGDRVQVRGETKGRRFAVSGEWRVDRKAMWVDWGVDNNPDYGGSLRVSREGRGSRVDGLLRFRVWTPEQIQRGSEREWELLVQHDLERTLQALKELLERPARGAAPEVAPTG